MSTPFEQAHEYGIKLALEEHGYASLEEVEKMAYELGLIEKEGRARAVARTVRRAVKAPPKPARSVPLAARANQALNRSQTLSGKNKQLKTFGAGGAAGGVLGLGGGLAAGSALGD